MPVSKEIIRQCKKGDEKAQGYIFEKYSSVIFGICLRFMKNKAKAEDVLQDTFVTVFTKIKQYKGKGSFEGWMKRIAINTALMQLRVDKKETISNEIDNVIHFNEKENDEKELNIDNPRSVIENAKLSQTDILNAVSELPDGFRTVFNLYVIDGYKHKEIAKELNISLGTSKSQLMRARNKLEKTLYKIAIKKLKTKKR